MATSSALLTIGPLRVHAAAMGLGFSVAAHAGLLAAMGFVPAGSGHVEPASVLFSAGAVQVHLAYEASAEPSFEAEPAALGALDPAAFTHSAPSSAAPIVIAPPPLAGIAPPWRPVAAAHAEAPRPIEHAEPLHAEATRVPRRSPLALRAPADEEQFGRAAPRDAEPGIDRGVRAIDLVAPHYPERCRRAAHAGTVLLEVEVGTDGVVGDVRVIGASPCPDLSAAAFAAARASRFQPALRAGRPIEAKVEVPFEFTLR